MKSEKKRKVTQEIWEVLKNHPQPLPVILSLSFLSIDQTAWCVKCLSQSDATA